MNKRRAIRMALVTGALLLLAGGCALWLWAQQRQYALNRQLITALAHDDDQQALALVKSGADPNTRYDPTPIPSLRERWNRLLHHTPPPENDSPTAFLIANGAKISGYEDDATLQGIRSDAAPLVRAMLSHGAHINDQDLSEKTVMNLAARLGRPNTMKVLLEAGANVNLQDNYGWTPLDCALYHDGDRRTIQQLLAHRADPNLLTNTDTNMGLNALTIAEWLNRPDLITLLLQHGAKKQPNPKTSVPAIARLLGVQVGFNGQDALTHPFGDGLHTTGGHAGGCVHWYTRSPRGYIQTDGFPYNREGLLLEYLLWGLDTATDPTIPFARRLPRQAGWLGDVYPGMTAAQVTHLASGRLPPPKRKGNTWTWTAKGYVRPSLFQHDVYTTWTADLTFQKGILNLIEVKCE